ERRGNRLAGWWATISNFCTSPNLTWKIMQSNLTFFRFLHDLDRRKKWVKKCRTADLEDKTPDQLKHKQKKNDETSEQKQTHKETTATLGTPVQRKKANNKMKTFYA
ncbi:hypothetical protein HPG69_008734, partial [Diceros bicornis minor]